MQPSVSVIVPVYNIEQYIGKCLDSVIGQTLKEIEIIVVDDGSTDDSSRIIDRYVNRFPYRRHSQNERRSRIGTKLRNSTGNGVVHSVCRR